MVAIPLEKIRKKGKIQCDSLVHCEVMIFIDADGVLCRE